MLALQKALSGYYCLVDHQKRDWKAHKLTCVNSNINTAASMHSTETKAEPTSKGSLRECRCMFCGDNIVCASEEEAVDHMARCSALQEQLQSKEQFTVPKSYLATPKT
jgi:hypothetical protein